MNVRAIVIGLRSAGFFIGCTLSSGPALAANAPTAQTDFEQVAAPFFQEHCYRCHGEKKQKAEFRLDLLARDFAGGSPATRWIDVMDRIKAAEMPPDDEPQPKPDETTKVVEWLARRLSEGEATRLAQRERVTLHKLTREEYAYTIKDLLGVNYDATDPTGLLEDPDWHGFERIGAMLSLSPAHIEKYFAAAESILAEALPHKRAEPVSVHWNAQALQPKTKVLNPPGPGQIPRVAVWPGSTFDGQPGNVMDITLPASGDYTVRIKLSGLKPPRSRPPHVAIYAVGLDRMLFEQDVDAPEDQPVILEFQTHLSAGKHPIRLTNEAHGPSLLPRAGRADPFHYFYSVKDGRAPWQTKLTDEAGQPIFPFLIVDWVEWKGPIQASSPTFAQQHYGLKSEAGPEEVREVLGQFAEAAFRRPARPSEVDYYTKLVEREMQTGEKRESALKTGLLAILCAKDFLYLVEGSPGKTSNRLTDWEVASRLSYFLWSTMPDGPLRAAAARGTLHQPMVLRAEIARMLGDSKIARFTQAFSRQWLQLRQVGMFPPDKKRYPTYDDYLQKSMIGETTAYFHEVLANDLTLREFLDSNWTMLNARLATHYGIPNVTDDRFQRVPLRPEDRRGGLLTHAAILSQTSDGARHRPVHRGKWILESIIGKPPPPPPANVKPIEPTPVTEPKATLRMKLAAHQSDPQCASCHRKIDPLGVAFDNYDAIGRWRTEENVTDGAGDNPKVDASGEFPDGRTFADASGLKQLLLEDIDKFNSAFVEKLATFALRRPMTIDDRANLAQVAQQSKAANFRLSAIIEALVLSDLFKKR